MRQKVRNLFISLHHTFSLLFNKFQKQNKLQHFWNIQNWFFFIEWTWLSLDSLRKMVVAPSPLGLWISTRFGDDHQWSQTTATKGGGRCSPKLIQKLLWSLKALERVLDHLSSQHWHAWISGVPQQTTLNLTSVVPLPAQPLTVVSEESPFLLFQPPNVAWLLLSVRKRGFWEM